MSLRNKDTLLIIGDEHSDRDQLCKIFESKYYILEAENAYQGSLLIAQNQAYIVAVLADIPLDELKKLAETCSAEVKKAIPLVAVVEATATGANEEYAFVLGASDVVLKPYTTMSILRRVEVFADLNMHQKNLERLVESQSETIRHNSQIMIDTLATIIEHRSNETGNHVLRIRNFTKILLEEIAKNFPEYKLTPEIIAIITNASSLHDIGKVSIPDQILNKPGKLTDEEFEIMKTHTTIGSKLIDNFKYINDETYLRYIYNVILYHHERWDGKGYPKGLVGDEIPICAQVVGVTDAYDSLTTKRAYKSAYSHEVAINMILNGECGEFSPKILDCLKSVQKKFEYLSKKFADENSVRLDELSLELPSHSKTEGTRNALQITQRKYHAILHCLNDTVIEMDLNNKIYHVVYNPNPDFATVFKNLSFENLSETIIKKMIHPDEADLVRRYYGVGMTKIFLQGGQTFRFNCSMRSLSRNCYFPYEVTMQKIVSDDPKIRQLIMVFRKLDKNPSTQSSESVGNDILRANDTDRRSSEKAEDDKEILRMGNNVTFEGDLESGVIIFENWKKRFGYDLDFLQVQDEDGLHRVHVEDRLTIYKALRAIQKGEGSYAFDVRIINAEGKYVWSRVIITKAESVAGRLNRVFGVIYDIDDLKRDAISIKQQAQEDELTGLLNKSSIQKTIKSYLETKPKDSMCGLLIMDVDNFKTINDSLGHFYGDEVLKRIGSTLKSLFRAKDAVGRIGGDEFIILLKDLPNQEVLDERCKLLCNVFRTLFASLTPDLPVSVSVGAVMAPRHGKTYAELYKRADEALYTSKNRGKNQYFIYSSNKIFEQRTVVKAATTKIDSDTRGVLSDDAVFQFAFKSLYESHDLEKSIQELLAYIGIHFNVSRVYVFENNDDNTACSNTFEWCNVGIPSEKDFLQNLNYETDIPDWNKVYDENGILYCPDVSKLPPEIYKVVEPQGIKSMLHCAIKEKGVLRGFIGFDECNSNRLWTKEQINILELVSGVLSVFVTKLRNEK